MDLSCEPNDELEGSNWLRTLQRLQSAMPADRIAASMKTGNHREGIVGLDEEHKKVWEVPEDSASNIAVHKRELVRIGLYALYRSVHLCAKSLPKAFDFVFVPVLRVQQFISGSRGEVDRVGYGQRRSSSAFSASQVTLSRRSASRRSRRRSSSSFWAAETGS